MTSWRLSRKVLWPIGLLALAALCAFPAAGADIYFIRLLAGLWMYVALAASWNLIGGYTGYLNLGHVTFFGLGAYIAAELLVQKGISPFLTAPLAGLAACVLALIIGYPTLRLRGPYFAVMTLSIAFLAQVIFQNMTQVGGGLGIEMPAPPTDLHTTESLFYWAFLGLALMVVAVNILVERSRFGLSLLAIRNDEAMAEISGVAVTRAKILAFLLSAFFPGVIGAVFAYQIGYIEPGMAFDIKLSINLVLMVMLGGAARWAGPVIGAVIIYLLSQTLVFIIPTELNQVLFGVILVIVIYTIPRGILGMLSSRRQAAPLPAAPAGADAVAAVQPQSGG